MKYWVYKESQILGPFDKEGVGGLPGVDEGTLVCEGDPSGGSWVPAGSVGLAAPGSGTLGSDDLPSAAGLLDQLQIDTAGLVGDDDFPGALAHDLFQDADYKRSFGDVLADRGPASEAEAARSRDKISELTVQLEHLYRHIAQLEAGHTDLSRRLAEKEMELRSRGAAPLLPETAASAAPPPEAAPARTFLSPVPPAPPASAPPADATPSAPSDWGQTAGAGAPLPAIFGDAKPPTKLVVPGVPGLSDVPPAPPSPSFAAAPALPADAAVPAPPPLPEIPAPAPKTQGFGKPKSFKVVPTAKSFKVVGPGDAPPPASALPAPEFSAPPEPVAAAAPPPAPVLPPAPLPVIEPVAPPPAPVVIAPVAPPPPPPPPPMPTPAPIDFAPPAASPFAPPEPAAPTPAPPPPNTLSRSQPVPDLGATEAVPSFADSSAPPMTMARRGGAAAEPPADAPAEDGAAARFAKPAPPETAQPKPARSNKKFLIAGGVLLTLLLGVTVLFMRQPKDDLKQMASLDDGKPPVGLGAEDQSPAPIVKPRIAEPEPAPAPVPAGPSAEQEAAIAAVKDFPLDGGRGTVGRWLQYSYTASPGAGTEEWNASATAENTTLVEYRFVPAPGGSGKGALYLFELDGIGLVMGKNLEARQMLAGAPPAEAAPVKKAKAPKKKPVKRRPVYEEPKELPQLPLPDSGELRPPAEDDGSFGSDTVNGI